MNISSIEKISSHIIPMSAFHSLRENGFDTLYCDINMETFSDIVNNSNPITAVSLLRAFYLYYKILLTKYFIQPLKKKKGFELKWVLENEKELRGQINETIKNIETKILH